MYLWTVKGVATIEVQFVVEKKLLSDMEYWVLEESYLHTIDQCFANTVNAVRRDMQIMNADFLRNVFIAWCNSNGFEAIPFHLIQQGLRLISDVYVKVVEIVINRWLEKIVTRKLYYMSTGFCT